MGVRMKNIGNLFSDVKTRTIIIFTAIMLLTAIGIGVANFGSSTSTTNSGANVSDSPDVEAIPGGTTTTPEVAQVQSQLNQQRLQQAQTSSQSFIPTVIGQSPTQSTNSAFSQPNTTTTASSAQTTTTQPQFASASTTVTQIPTATTTASSTSTNATSTDPTTAQQLSDLQKQLQDQQQQLQQAQQALTKQKAQGSQEDQASTQAMTEGMANQAKAIMSSWSDNAGGADQIYVEGDAAQNGDSSDDSQDATNDGTADQSSEATVPADIKAGDILFAVLDTAVNSDEPGPILATIVAGKHKGSKLLGRIQKSPTIVGTNGPIAVTLVFNTLSGSEQPVSTAVNAVAIDPGTARTALSSDVDHHYLLRYGTLFASSFLEGYGNAITQAGSISFNVADGSSAQFQQELDPSEEFFAALGEVGTQWGDELSDVFDRPNTVIVDPGVSLGILFLADVTF